MSDLIRNAEVWVSRIVANFLTFCHSFQCHLYHAGRIAGSMCHTLCEEQKLVYEQCGNYRGGKKVLYMDCMDCELGLNTRVVLKTKDELAKREFMYLPKGQNGELNQQWQKAAHEILRSNVKYNFAIDLSHIEDIFSYLWGENVGKYAKSTRFPKVQNITIAQTVYALTRQLEYTFYLLHKDKSFVPKIYGTCGPAYLLEYTPAISEYESGLPSLSWLFTQSFRDRAKIAIELLKLLKTIDNDLHQPLHLCDVKGDNFGIRDNGEITLIDTDCATFQDTLFETFFSDNCSSHHDCDFFDCHGYCDTVKGKCRQIRTNNNLQVIVDYRILYTSSQFILNLLNELLESLVNFI